MSYKIEAAQVAPRVVAGTTIHTSLSRIGESIGVGFARLMHVLTGEGGVVSGAPLVVYLTMIDEDTEGDIEVCLPIAATIDGNSGVYSRELEGGTMATTVHTGAYQEIGAAYAALQVWISENGYEIAGPPREIYLNDPQEVAPEELLTRVEFPVKGTT